VVANAQARGGFEIVEPTFRVLSAVTQPLPVPLGQGLAQAKLPALLDHAPTVLRDPTRRAVFELASAAMLGFRATLTEAGFTEIQTPKLVGSATESGANVFPVSFFGQPSYLAQSPQLYKQIMVGVFERVFEVGPVFRAEPHATVRHLAEYVSLDVEVGFIEDHRDVIAVLRRVLAGILEAIERRCAAALTGLGVTLPTVPAVLPSIEFGEALARCEAAGATDLAPEHERALGAWAHAEHGSDFLVVTGYPAAKRPFYTHPMPGNPEATNSFDLLFRGTELVTGGQRLHDHAALVAAMHAAGIDPTPLAGYLEAFAFGMPPHGGFAIGLERLLTGLLELPNIRLATLFPRDKTRLSP
jgi:nondiscriminating aspartyl-tRNA synthetase